MITLTQRLQLLFSPSCHGEPPPADSVTFNFLSRMARQWAWFRPTWSSGAASWEASRDLVSHPSIQNISDCIKAKYNKKKKRPNHPYTSGEGRVTAPLSQIGNLISSTRTEMLFDVRCCHLSGFLIHCYCLWRCWGFLTDKQQGGLLLNWQRRSI